MFESVINLAHQSVDEKLIPGIALSIITKEESLTDVYGLSKYPDTPLQDNAVYDIASLTKMFTTTRILQLIEDGKLSLDTPIKDILPEFKEESILIKHCLLHRSGMLPSVRGRYTMNHDEMVTSILNCDDWVNPVDTKMDYSCINYLILGLVIEALDTSLDQSIFKTILKPLHMSDTQYNPCETSRCVPTEYTDARGLICGVVHDETAHNFGGVAGNAGLFSTMSDLNQFVKSYLGYETPVLTQETLKLLNETNVDMRSYGWNLHPYKGKNYLFHTGFTGPSILLDLDNQAGFIILTNRIHPKREDTGYLKRRLELFDAFLEEINQ